MWAIQKPLTIEPLYEDKFILAISKPSGLFTHPMAGEMDSKDCALFQARDIVKKQLYPINRLDRPVSGIVLFAKAPEFVKPFQLIWHLDSTQKTYLTLHKGNLESAGVFDSPLSKQGVFKNKKEYPKTYQEALTNYFPIEHFPTEFCTYTKVQIQTGRYHQIRRHFRKAILPIVGDTKHGKGVMNRFFRQSFSLNRIFLHCSETQLIHPFYPEKLMQFKSELPRELAVVLKSLRERKITKAPLA